MRARGRPLRSRLLTAVGVALVLAWPARLGYLGWALWQDARAVQALADGDRTPASVIALAHNLREDLGALQAETWPLLQLLTLARPLPYVGPALASAGPVLDLAAGLAVAADEDLQALAPALDRPEGADPLLILLQEVQARQERLRAAAAAAQDAVRARDAIPPDAPEFLTRRLAQLDPYLPLVEQGAATLAALPELLGVDRPRTYLVLVQNSDELRPTGGFIGSVGILRVDAGRITFQIQNSYALDDFPHRAYPPPPEPLRAYMGADLWLLRDANWSPDFPTAARDAAGLYRLGQDESVAGVLALDQTALKYLLAATGPVPLSDGSGTVSAQSFDLFLRDQWKPEPGSLDPGARGYQSSFMSGLGESLVAQLSTDPAALDLPTLAQVLTRILYEKHLLIYLTEPGPAGALAAGGWDGALSPGEADYLYIVDSNVGFNKANSALRRSVAYHVDLSDLAHPAADLTVQYQLTGQAGVPCRQINVDYGQGGYESLVQGCYWNYLRVYAPGGSTLIAGEPHPAPGDWLWNGQPSDGAVTAGNGESGTAVFGQLLVVPAGAHLAAHMTYALPRTTVRGTAYCVRFEKQPGTDADPLQFSLDLPNGAVLQSASQPPSTRQDTTLTFELQLNVDREVCITWTSGD